MPVAAVCFIPRVIVVSDETWFGFAVEDYVGHITVVLARRQWEHFPAGVTDEMVVNAVVAG